MGDRQYGIDPKRLAEYAEDIKEVVNKGVEVAIVIGGGKCSRHMRIQKEQTDPGIGQRQILMMSRTTIQQKHMIFFTHHDGVLIHDSTAQSYEIPFHSMGSQHQPGSINFLGRQCT